VAQEATDTVEVAGEEELGHQLRLVKATNNDLLTRELHQVKWQAKATHETVVEIEGGALGVEVTEVGVEEQGPQQQWAPPLPLDPILCQGTS
jgi:hypothetical protein